MPLVQGGVLQREAVRRHVIVPVLLLGWLVAACGDAPAPETAPVAQPAPTATLVEAPSAPEPVRVDLPLTPTPAPESDVVSEKWYTMLEDGQQAGWLHVVWTREERDGAVVIHDHTERFSRQTRQMGFVEDTFEVSTTSDLVRTEDGLFLDLRSTTVEPGRETLVLQTWTGSGYSRTASVGGVEQHWQIECEEPVPADAEALLAARIVAGTVTVGDTLTYPVLNFAGERLDTAEIVVKGRELLALSTGSADCFVVDESVRGAPGSVRMWLDEEGVIRQYVVGDMRLVHSTEARARDVPIDGVSYSITVEADPNLPRGTDFERAEVHVTVPTRGGRLLPDFPDTPFSREIGRDGDTIRLALSAHDDPDATVPLPVADESLAHWLRPTLLECSADPDVAAAARTAIGDETDGRKVAALLLRAVFDRLEKGSGPVASPNAAEILRDGMGDCSEHAVLFVAFCRAVGLPARRLSGYAMVGNLWGSHAFCEVWLGQWIGADPTTNELGTRARYIAFGWSDDPDSFPGEVSSRMRGRARIKTVAFRDHGEDLVVADLAKTATHDPYSDLTLAEPPEGWKIRIGPMRGFARVQGPGFRASVRVSSGMGYTPADLIAQQMHVDHDTIRQFAGVESVFFQSRHDGGTSASIMIPYRRRLLMIDADVDAGTDVDAALAAFADLLAPTISSHSDGE